MTKALVSLTRRNFLTGLAVALPVIISVGVMGWLFGTVSNFTDSLLFFLPRAWTHEDGGKGEVIWYWSLAALALAFALLCGLGQLTRYYVGKQIILFVDGVLLQVPLLNKVYGTLKQVNEAFASSSKSSFQQVVLVRFPHPGVLSIGFITNSEASTAPGLEGRGLISVFVPTTPNPTTGFLVMVPESEVIRLDMPVSEGIKCIISLGSLAPDWKGGGGERGRLPEG